MSYGVTIKEFSDALVRLVNAPLCKHYETHEQNPVRESTKCQFCGAPLTISKAKNGICKCEWCRAENYVGGIETIEYDSDYDPELIEVTSLEDTTHRYIAQR